MIFRRCDQLRAPGKESKQCMEMSDLDTDERSNTAVTGSRNPGKGWGGEWKQRILD